MSKYDVILDVYENQSISKAAQKHNYTQSAVSQSIRNYEKEIGLKLFKRSKNGMEALPGTEPIFEELMHIRSANTRIDQIVSNINNLDSGFIRIGTVQSIAYNWLPGVLKNFSAEYPNITFRLYVDGFQNLTEKLRKKELDCIFVSQYVAKDFPNLPVGTDELVLVTSLDHPLADQLTVSFADIDGQDFVLSADDFDYETGKLFRLNHITPNVKMSTLNSTFFHVFIVLPFCTIRSLFYCIFSLLGSAIVRLPLLPASHAPYFRSYASCFTSSSNSSPAE